MLIAHHVYQHFHSYILLPSLGRNIAKIITYLTLHESKQPFLGPNSPGLFIMNLSKFFPLHCLFSNTKFAGDLGPYSVHLRSTQVYKDGVAELKVNNTWLVNQLSI